MNLHLNWDGYQNNGVIFNDTYDGCLFEGSNLKPALSFSFHSFTYSENPRVANQVVNTDESLRMMTPEEETEVIALATSWEQELGQEGNPNDEQKMQFIRWERNRLLAETDYLALTDSTLTDEMSTYRQQLRDLPATVDINNPVYPNKPN